MVKFSLRALFVFILLICIGAALVGGRVRRYVSDTSALSVIRTAGGTVEYDYQFKDDIALGKVDPPGPQWFVRVFGVESVASPVVIQVEAEMLTEEVVKAIVQLKSLRAIRVIKRLHNDADERAVDMLHVAVPSVELKEYAF